MKTEKQIDEMQKKITNKIKRSEAKGDFSKSAMYKIAKQTLKWVKEEKNHLNKL